jgi:glycosyltransferase involved in cell wall biosynthesis
MSGPAYPQTIIHIENAKSTTGSYNALLWLCASTADNRHVWVLPTGSQVASEAAAKFQVYEIPFLEISRSIRNIVGYIPMFVLNACRLRHIFLAEHVDLIHINDLYNLTPYLARLGISRRIPIVVHVRMLRRSFPAVIYNFWRFWHLHFADRIVAVSRAVAADWDSAERVHIVYDAPILTERHRQYVCTRNDGGKARFVYLANYIPGKGQDFALDVVTRVAERTAYKFSVDFVGGVTTQKDHIFRETLEKTAKTRGLEQIVAFYGKTYDVEESLKQYDALLHFSESESFGMACYEALYYGVPVISTACGGPEEMIVDGVSGLLVPFGDIEKAAAAIIRFMEHASLAEIFSRNGKRWSRDKASKNQANLRDVMTLAPTREICGPS